MNVYEALTYGKRRGFVYLRYVAMAFFFISQVATYFVILNFVTQANNAVQALGSGDAEALLSAFASFKIPGALGVFVEVMRSLGVLVIPLYFIATVSFVLNLNRKGIGKITQRTALFALLLFVAEFLVYSVMIAAVYVIVGSLFEYIQGEYADILEAVDRLIKALNSEANMIPFENVGQTLDAAQNFLVNQVIVILIRNVPSFNFFIDELLCLLLCIFFCFRPKRINTRAKLIAYRCLGIIPVLYILGAFIVNGLTQLGIMSPGILLLSAFPARRLPHFLFIGCILLCNRHQPIRSLGNSADMKYTYIRDKKYRATPLVAETPAAAKKRSLQAAVFLSVCLVLLSAIDYFFGYLPYAVNWGFGKSYYMVFCIPFLFFFDDRKPTLKKDFSVFSLLYFAVIVVVVLIYLFF